MYRMSSFSHANLIILLQPTAIFTASVDDVIAALRVASKHARDSKHS